MDTTATPRWWTVLRWCVASASLGFGLSVVLAWVANLMLSRVVADDGAAAGMLAWLQVLGWIELVLSVVVVAGLAVGAWLHRPLWARGVASVIIGMVLHWGWWVLDRRFDLFGTYGLAEGDPGLAGRMEARLWTMLAVDVASVLALVLGGVLLLRHRHPGDGGAGAGHGLPGAPGGEDPSAAG